MEASATTQTGLYVGDLDEQVTTNEIYEHFKQFQIIMVNHREGKPFAFLYFKTKQDGTLLK